MTEQEAQEQGAGTWPGLFRMVQAERDTVQAEVRELREELARVKASKVSLSAHLQAARAQLQAAEAERDRLRKAGIPTNLLCPACGQQHIDEGEWAAKPHRTHLCANCGTEWQPFEVATYGVSDDLTTATTLLQQVPIAIAAYLADLSEEAWTTHIVPMLAAIDAHGEKA